MDEEFTEILRKVKDKWGRETVAAILRKIDSYPIRWQGTLRRSVSYSQDPGLDGDINFFMADYGQFIDDGVGIFGPRKQRIPPARKGALAYHLKTWSNSKGLNSWAVATNIIKRGGIRPRPFFNSVIDSRINLLGQDVEKALELYINNKVNKA